MPTYNHGAFIRRALASLFAQTFKDWELILIDDGSTDYTEDVVQDYKQNQRIRFYKNVKNKGLGYCLNLGMKYARSEIICYLPSDDVFFKNHLASLHQCLMNDDSAVLAYSGLYYGNADNYSQGLAIQKTQGQIPGHALQLVQVMHRKCAIRWVERDEFVTGDLSTMFWDKLKLEGKLVETKKITCEWVNHPYQRHKIISERFGGGIEAYKKFYGIEKPIRFHLKNGHYIDEIQLSTQIKRELVAKSSLKILLVGEASFNPERLCAFEEKGHTLYGLWIPNPDFHNSVGPFKFGNISDLDIRTFQVQINSIKPDIIYGLLNSQAVRLAHRIMISNPDIPFVWHFKEGPMFCRNMGIWKELFELYYNADGRLYINDTSKNWFEQFIGQDEGSSFVLDGDLPSRKYFSNNRSPLLSNSDGEIHTVICGRPYGILPADVLDLAKHNVHLHLYGEFYHAKWRSWIDEVNHFAPGYLHLHAQCKAEYWTSELSQYDAGWLHSFRSENNGELIRCSWDDLNYPARMSTLAAAGLPMIMRNNSGNIVASQSLVESLNCGILFNSMNDLGEQLNDSRALAAKRNAVWEKRMLFTFDYYIDDLISFFRKVIKEKTVNDQIVEAE